MSVQDLRDVLRERADGPSPPNPARHEQVGARVRGTRRRRRITAGAAMAAAVAIGFSVFPGAQAPKETTAVTTTAVQERLPERFTAADGTEYRRLAAVTIGKTGEQKVTVTVPVSGKPLDVAAACPGAGHQSTRPDVYVGDKLVRLSGFGGCSPQMDLRPLDVAQRDGQVSVTFDATSPRALCERRVPGGPRPPCRTVLAKPADWSLAVYEWTPPAQPVEPAPVRRFPDRFEGWKLARTESGIWPQDRTVRLEVEGGRAVALDQLCTGDLARRMWFSVQVGGAESNGSTGCGVWESGPFPAALSEVEIPEGERAVITVRLGSWGEVTNRPVRWSIGVYTK
jgi:hypothetical protein